MRGNEILELSLDIPARLTDDLEISDYCILVPRATEELFIAQPVV